MRIVFQLLLLISFVLCSPLVFIVLSFRMASISADTLKAQLVKKDVYQSAILELHKQIDSMSEEGERDDPLVIVGPFVKKEISTVYIRGKVETLLDDTQAWIKGNAEAPVLSFKDLKEKLLRQNKQVIVQLESAMKEMEKEQAGMREQFEASGESGVGEMPAFSPKDLDTFLKSDFTIPMGAYLGWVKVVSASMYILGIILACCYGISLLLLILLAPSLQSKLRWVGWTLLFTALWNIPGIVLSAGSSVVIAKTFTQSMSGAMYITPFVESLITPIIASYARVTSGAVVMMIIFSIGILVISLLTKPAEVAVSPTKSPEKKKKV